MDFTALCLINIFFFSLNLKTKTENYLNGLTEMCFIFLLTINFYMNPTILLTLSLAKFLC